MYVYIHVYKIIRIRNVIGEVNNELYFFFSKIIMLKIVDRYFTKILL